MAFEPAAMYPARSGAVVFGDDGPAPMPAVEMVVAGLYTAGIRRFLIAADAYGDSGILELSSATLKGVMREETGPVDYRVFVEFDPPDAAESGDKGLFIERFKDFHRHAANGSPQAEQALERLGRVMGNQALCIEQFVNTPGRPMWKQIDELLDSRQPTVAEFLTSELFDKNCPGGKDTAMWFTTSPWRPSLVPVGAEHETSYKKLREINILERANDGPVPTAVLLLNQRLTARGSSRQGLHESGLHRGNAILEVATGPVHGNVTVVLPVSVAQGLQDAVGSWPAVGLYMPDVAIDPCDSVPGGKDRYDTGSALERTVRTLRERGVMKIMLPELHKLAVNGVLALGVARGAGGGDFFQETRCCDMDTRDQHELARQLVRIHRYNAQAGGIKADPASEAGLLDTLEHGFSIHLVQFCFGRRKGSVNETLVHDDMLAFARHPEFAIFSGGASHVMSQVVSQNVVNDSWRLPDANRLRKLSPGRQIPGNFSDAGHDAAVALQKLMYGGFWLAQEVAPTVMILSDQFFTSLGVSRDRQYEWASAHNLSTLSLPFGNAGSATLMATEEVMLRYVLGVPA